MAKSSKSSSRRGQSPRATSSLQQLAHDPIALRRTHTALHRFVDQLEADVQDAVDAARSRRLVPIKHVAKVCRYLQRRYLPVGQAKKTNPRKPTGLIVDPDFVLGLMCLTPTQLAKRVAELQAAIDALKPFEGKPFKRKPIVAGDASARADTQKKLRAEARLAAKEGPEGVGVAALERAGTNLVNLFRDLVARFAARLASGKRSRKRPGRETSEMLTPPALAKRLGVSADKVRGWIKSGQLVATDVCKQPGGKPQYRISEDAVREFEKKRQPETPPPARRRRPKKDPGVTKFF